MVFFFHPLNLELAMRFDLANGLIANVTQVKTWKFLCVGRVLSCCSWEPYNHHQVNEPGLSCCMMRKKGPVTPVTLFDSLSTLSWLQTYAWVRPKPTEELPSWAQCKFLIPTQGVRSWHTLYVRFSSGTELTLLFQCSALNSLLHPHLGVSQPLLLSDRLLSKHFSLHSYSGTRGCIKSL